MILPVVVNFRFQNNHTTIDDNWNVVRSLLQRQVKFGTAFGFSPKCKHNFRGLPDFALQIMLTLSRIKAPFHLRNLSSQSQFWPPGPPPYHSDPAIKSLSSQLYAELVADHLNPPAGQIDPWARREAWRYHPYFSSANVVKHAFPGLSWALVAFAGYCGYEYVTDDSKH